MDTSREDVGISIRSALLDKGTKQRFSLILLIIFSSILIFIETIETKPLSFIRSIIKDTIYRGSVVISYPGKSLGSFSGYVKSHVNLYNNYKELEEENKILKNNISKSDFLELENEQLKKLIDEQVAAFPSNLVSARVMLDKQSPYLNSFIINVGGNKNIKNGMAVLDGQNFIGRIVDVNFFSSRVLLVTDLNSKIPVVAEPSATHAILSGHGIGEPTLEYLPTEKKIKTGDKVYTSGKEGIFAPGIPIGRVNIDEDGIKVILFSDLQQITFVNINLDEVENKK